MIAASARRHGIALLTRNQKVLDVEMITLFKFKLSWHPCTLSGNLGARCGFGGGDGSGSVSD